MDKRIESRHSSDQPLIWLACTATVLECDSESIDLGGSGSARDVRNLALNISEDEYLDSVKRIQDYIAAGDTYQVNYTCKLVFEHAKPARFLFSRLRKAHPVGYSAFINTGDARIISLSPELFLRREGSRLLSRPMKGTARRGRWFEEDDSIARGLAVDEKNRAEKIMIVDLMRNDIGRVSSVGTVTVPRMFGIERYASVFQMTSDVEGRPRDGTTASDMLRAAFPPGSITGAPKIRAMEIIDELEHDCRGVYCGCIGMFRPDGDWMLNVAIRTIVQRDGKVRDGDRKWNRRRFGSQSGTGGNPAQGRILSLEPMDFHLVETMLYEHGNGYAFLPQHLDRLECSAEYFGWSFSRVRRARRLWLAKSSIRSPFQGSSPAARLAFGCCFPETERWISGGPTPVPVPRVRSGFCSRAGKPIRMTFSCITKPRAGSYTTTT